MKKKRVIVDHKTSYCNTALVHCLEKCGFDCDWARGIDDEQIRSNDYKMVFVHLSVNAGERKPAETVREIQRNAFIIGMGAHSKKDYSKWDLEGCDDFYEKGGKIGIPSYMENLLNEMEEARA